MNRRGFFANMLGAACLAAAERIMPSALVKLAAPVTEPVMTFQGIPIRFVDGFVWGPSPSADVLSNLEVLNLMNAALRDIPVSGRKVVYRLKG